MEAITTPQQQQFYHIIALPLDISKASQWQHHCFFQEEGMG
jgi:hypothetical protein